MQSAFPTTSTSDPSAVVFSIFRDWELTFVSSLSKCLKVASNSSSLAGVTLVCVADTIWFSTKATFLRIPLSASSSSYSRSSYVSTV